MALIGFLVFYASKNQKKPDSPANGDMPANASDSASSSSAPSMADSSAPDFDLKDSSAHDVRLSDYKGKVVIVDFWATWCPTCRQEIPGLMALQKQYGNKGLQVIGVSVDSKGWEAIRPFMQKQGVNYPVLLGNADVVRAYGNFDSIPLTFVINRQEKIVKQFSGLHTPEEFEKEVASLL
ncbi:MAG TPA: TlpA disulfide reductase family protein [Candidatus Kapabacteria bacterium]|nr:TlpA disulfide reductase family protein [Candidatus Kapabacteria bacterium]